MRKLTVLLLMICLFCVPAASVLADNMIPLELSDGMSAPDIPGVSVENDIVTITVPGEYLVSGSLKNGQIVVDCKERAKTTLYLNGVSIHCETSAAILINESAPRCTLSLVEGKENTLSNGKSLIYTNDSKDEPDGVIYSLSDVTITGNGSLSLEAGAMNGISSKDDLRIESGSVSIQAPNHGIKGKDCVEISGGTLRINAGRDGIKATHKKDPALGYIDITGGEIHIVFGDEAISFTTRYSMTGGTMACEMRQE